MSTKANPLGDNEHCLVILENPTPTQVEDAFKDFQYVISHNTVSGRWSVISDGSNLNELKTKFGQLETGWYGPINGLHIHSPLLGSILSVDDVAGIVTKWLDEVCERGGV